MPSPFTLADLCDAVDVTPRTVRYYIQQGLLPPADGAGQAASYNDHHLGRLRFIKALQGQHLPLAEIRTRVEELTDEEERRWIATPEPAPSTAAEYIRSALAAPLLAAEPAAMPNATLGPGGSVRVPARPAPTPAAGPSAPAFGGRSAWERVVLTKDVELHVRRPLDLQTNRRLEKLMEAARALFKETP